MTTKNSKDNWKRYGNTEGTDKYECFYCGERLHDHNRTVDHMIPKSKGGILSNDNKVYSCRRCNQFKADTDMETFTGMAKFLMKDLQAAHDEKISYYVRLTTRLNKLMKQDGKQDKGTKHTS